MNNSGEEIHQYSKTFGGVEGSSGTGNISLQKAMLMQLGNTQ